MACVTAATFCGETMGDAFRGETIIGDAIIPFEDGLDAEDGLNGPPLFPLFFLMRL